MTAAAPRSSLRVWLNPKHGPMLVAMADMFDLHWATAWVDNANTIIAPLIGLPELPVIRWTNYHPLDTPLTVLPPFEQTRSARAGGNRRSVERVHWKTRPIAQYTALLDDNPAGRPFVWMDDEITDADRYYLAQVGSVGPHLLHRIDPAVGMTAVDLDLMRAWAAAL